MALREFLLALGVALRVCLLALGVALMGFLLALGVALRVCLLEAGGEDVGLSCTLLLHEPLRAVPRTEMGGMVAGLQVWRERGDIPSHAARLQSGWGPAVRSEGGL